MNKLILFIFLVAFAVSCRNPAGTGTSTPVDSTATANDTLVGDTNGIDSTLVND